MSQHAAVVALQVVGDERRRAQRVVGQEHARGLARRELLAIAEDAGARADRGLAMDQACSARPPRRSSRRRTARPCRWTCGRATARSGGRCRLHAAARPVPAAARRSARARRWPRRGRPRPGPRGSASWRCRGARDRALPNTDSTPAAERCRTSCAPKIRASPAYWSKRSWTRPSSIVSSTLDRRRTPVGRSRRRSTSPSHSTCSDRS